MGLRTGMESKLLLSFMGILAMAVGMACFLILQDHGQGMDAMNIDRATSLSQLLATASRTALQQSDREQLANLGHSLITQRDAIAVGFFDASGALISSAGADDVVHELSELSPVHNGRVGMLQPQRGDLPHAGHFLAVTSAVMARRARDASDQGMHVLGYVMLWVSEKNVETEMESATLKMVLVGTLTVLCCFPVAGVLTHNFFEPIRRLVTATRRIIAGDLEAQVVTDRPDMIGVLARTFNEMVLRVRQHQDALAAVNRELESKVQQRTSQLETANRRLSSEIAEKEDFLRAVSHDLNAPLRNISGMTMMLVRRHKEKLDADALHRLDRIAKNVEVGSDLISQLMELSRIKTQRQKLEVVDCRTVVEEAAGMFESDLRYRNIRFSIDGQLPSLRCEATRLRQVFQNLIDNAIKYMGDRFDSPREIRVGCTLRAGEAEFFVSDTGMGIPAQDVPTLFHVFRRGAYARANKVPGKGVGLASAKSIVETYSGTIWAESLLGCGATFRFTINGEYVVNSAMANAA
jgi:signal transduction histidine kinase